MNSLSSKILIVAASAALIPPATAFAGGVAHRSGGFRNQQSGVTAARGTAVKGPNGGQAIHGRAVSTDGAGNVTGARGTAFKGPNGTAGARGAVNTKSADGTFTHQSGSVVEGPNGGKAARAGETTVNPDGSATHQSGFAASGANRSIKSTGSSERGADGSASGSRTTTATRKNGNSVTTNTTWEKDQGAERTVSCTDASGATIPCKK
jgi:hypothetical protein